MRPVPGFLSLTTACRAPAPGEPVPQLADDPAVARDVRHDPPAADGPALTVPLSYASPRGGRVSVDVLKP